MAQKRMFAIGITNSDKFLEMPLSSQCLYFHLAMNADDEGFIGSPNSIRRMIGASEDDFRILIAKQFIIPFESGVCVVRHWRIHNDIRKGIRSATMYGTERSLIAFDNMYEKRAYVLAANAVNAVNELPDDHVNIGRREKQSSATLTGDSPMPNVNDGVNVDVVPDKYSIGKYSIDKDSIGEYRRGSRGNTPAHAEFVPPTVDEVSQYCHDRNNGINAQYFVDTYTANGWMTGRGIPMRDWKAAVRKWENNNYGSGMGGGRSSAWKNPALDYEQRPTSETDYSGVYIDLTKYYDDKGESEEAT